MTPENDIAKLVAKELEEMCGKYGSVFASLPEAYAVTLEEVEEASEEMDLLTGRVKDLWDAVRYNYEVEKKEQFIRDMHRYAVRCVKECIQVAACCTKALRGFAPEIDEKKRRGNDGRKEDYNMTTPMYSGTACIYRTMSET